MAAANGIGSIDNFWDDYGVVGMAMRGGAQNITVLEFVTSGIYYEDRINLEGWPPGWTPLTGASGSSGEHYGVGMANGAIKWTGMDRDAAQFLAAAAAYRNGDSTALYSILDQETFNFTGSNSDQAFHGYGGNDTLTGGIGSETLSGWGGNDNIIGAAGLEVLYGDGGNDTLDGGSGNNTIDGGQGNDLYLISGAAGVSYITDLGGFDTLRFNAAAVLNWEAGLFSGQTTRVSFTHNVIDRFEMSSEADQILLSEATNVNSQIDGGAGNDTLGGCLGSDTLFGGAGNDIIGGRSGADFIDGAADSDHLLGDSGDDMLRGGTGSDTLDGGTEIDTAFFDDHALGLTPGWSIDMIAGTARTGFDSNSSTWSETDTLISIENVQASSGNDTLYSNGTSTFYGIGGIDTLWLAPTVRSNLTISGFANANDTVNMAAGTATRTTITGINTPTLQTTTFSSIEVLHAHVGNDTVTGSASGETIYGDNGDDSLNGAGGQDTLFGGTGNDVIFYDAADNLAFVLGGADTDTLVFTAGAAPTTFNLTANEFERAEGRFGDPGGNAWTSYVNNYDSAWRLTHQTGLMDSGQTYYEDYDELNNQTWVRITYWNDALGRPDAETGQLDDGRTYDSDHDNGNLYTWSRIDYWRDALGRSDVETGFLDDGRSYNSDLDNGDAYSWDRIDNWADSLGRLDYQNGKYDADDTTRPGWSWQVDYDQANQFTWSRVERFWNSAGVLQSKTFFN